jgi:glycosyltransferase involved in cell wall biosynthesis
MRIVIIADSIDLQNAGIHVYTRNMIEALQANTGHEIICIRQGSNKNISFRNERVVKPLFPGIANDPFRVFYSIPRAIKSLKPDVVIEPAHFGPFNLPQNIKRVTVIHDLTPIIFPKWHKFLSRFLQGIFMKGILNRANLVLANSQNTLSDINKYYSFTKNKSLAIYPGVDPFFQVENNEIIDHKKPFFLFAGTIEPRKNLIVLLQAYELFRNKTGLNFKLFIVGGKGWKSGTFNKELKKHPFKSDIELKGYVQKEELRDLYLNATSFIYPSLYEGFGLPVIEAMACGAPCIVSNSSSLTEAGGEAAMYFSPRNPEELSLLMIKLALKHDVQKDMVAKGLQHVTKFSWKKFATELEAGLLKLKNEE